MSQESETRMARPVVQESKAEEHVEIELPATNDVIVMDYGAANALAEDLLRVASGKERKED